MRKQKKFNFILTPVDDISVLQAEDLIFKALNNPEEDVYVEQTAGLIKRFYVECPLSVSETLISRLKESGSVKSIIGESPRKKFS